MESYIEIGEAYVLGITVIDTQHKQLINLCNEAYTGIMNRDTQQPADFQKIMASAIRSAVDYAKYHFSEEEKILKLVGYEKFAEHKKAHDDFILKVVETAQEAEKTDFRAALDFVKYLQTWIYEHIMYADKLYVPAVQAWLKQAHSA
jgi:hemerythrin